MVGTCLLNFCALGIFRNVLIKAIANFRRALADKDTDYVQLLNRFTRNRGMVSNPSSSSIDLRNSADERASLLPAKDISEVSHLDYVSTILSGDIPSIPAPTPINYYIGKTLDVIAFIIAGVVLSKFWQLAGQAADMFTEDKDKVEQDAAHYTSAVIVTLANAYLWIMLVNKSTHLAANVLRRAVPSSITEKLHRRAHVIFTYVGITSSCLTFVPQLYFAEIAFPGRPEIYYPIGVISSIGTALGGAGATFALRDTLLERFTRNPTSRQLLGLDNQLQLLLSVIPKMKSKEFAAFLLSLNNELRAQLSSPSVAELEVYISNEYSSV